jgi:Zn-dependent protease with chaperone function
MGEKKILTDINPKAWEHPADRAALTALKQIPGVDEIVRKLIGVTTEKSIRLLVLASSVRVSDKQFPKLYKLLNESREILDFKENIELYVSQNPIMNAGAIGVDKPFILLNSAVIERLSEDELLAVIAHEAGHCASGHVLYKTLLWLIIVLSSMLIQIPIAGIALNAIIMALNEWNRKSELSADRAGLLVVQDPNVSYTALMKLAGGSKIGEMNINEFFLQAQEYESGGDIIDSVHKLINLVGQSHPFPVLRLSTLKTWVDSGSYEKILNGEYSKKSNNSPDDFTKDFDDAAKQYKEDISRSGDPLAEIFSKLGDNFDTARKQAENFFQSLFDNTKDDNITDDSTTDDSTTDDSTKKGE